MADFLKDQNPMRCFCKFPRSFFLLILVLRTSSALADWSTSARLSNYYTNDVGLFTASQRLSRDADPTQPALDTRLTRQGSDGVTETMVQVADAIDSKYGKTTFIVRGDGYLFYDHTHYSNGNVGVQASHLLPSKTYLMVRYYLNPDLFLGNNVEHRSGHSMVTAERVTSQIAAMHLGQELTDDLEVRLFSRYGTRQYNQAYEERNTDFWTVGPHVDWKITPGVTLGLAYHYEKGLAAGRHLPQFSDDVSYVNQFSAADLDIEVNEDWSLSFAFDYERNHWLSRLSGDDRNGAYEQVYFGQALVRYRIQDNLSVHCGLQHGSRKMNVETTAVVNTNVGLGLKAEF